MADISIILAKDNAGLDAVAEDSGLAIIAGTRRKFTALSTYVSDDYEDAGSIDTAKTGWMALAQPQA